MNFKVGQKISIGKTIGEDRGTYYHGETTRKVPLGAKAVIDDIKNSTMIHVRLENRTYGDSGGWYLHPDEIKITEEQERAEREAQRQIDSLLEQTLLGESSVVQPDVTQPGRKPFSPKFNAREEFAVWMREEFPNMNEGYPAVSKEFSERRKEIYEAAKKACKHGMDTTGGCIYGTFSDYSERITTPDNVRLYDSIRGLVNYIKKLSRSLKE